MYGLSVRRGNESDLLMLHKYTPSLAIVFVWGVCVFTSENHNCKNKNKIKNPFFSWNLLFQHETVMNFNGQNNNKSWMLATIDRTTKQKFYVLIFESHANFLGIDWYCLPSHTIHSVWLGTVEGKTNINNHFVRFFSIC